MRIGIVSDTHGCWDAEIEAFFAGSDAVWDAGDIGSVEVLDRMNAFCRTVAVHGNIDGQDVRAECPAELLFDAAGARVYMTHIGGWPRRYAPGIAERLRAVRPTIFVAGHSHILRVMYDEPNALLYINPGAYGTYGHHVVRTAIRMEIVDGQPTGLEVLNLPR